MFGLGVSTSALMCGSPFSSLYPSSLHLSLFLFGAKCKNMRNCVFLGFVFYDLIKPPAGREGQREKR